MESNDSPLPLDAKFPSSSPVSPSTSCGCNALALGLPLGPRLPPSPVNSAFSAVPPLSAAAASSLQHGHSACAGGDGSL